MERLLALLAAAYGRPVERRALGNIRRASEYWRRGEQCLASIELTLTGLPPLTDTEEACWRLHVADRLIVAGVTPRDAAEAIGIDLSADISSKANFNVFEPRVPAGNALGSGEWMRENSVNVVPAAARGHAGQSDAPGKFSKFFDTLYPQIHALADRLGIEENWLFGLAAYESEWLNSHNRGLNNPFGVTHGGGRNVGYPSIADAIAFWEEKYGPIVHSATSLRTSPSGCGRQSTIW